MKSTSILLIAILAFSFNRIAAQVLIPIEVIDDSTEFVQVIDKVGGKKNALYVFDIDNTLLITNQNGFGSDWWYSQTKTNPALKLGIGSDCLFGVLTPLFYTMFQTTGLYANQSETIADLGKGKSRTIGLTSREYSRSVATSTELALEENRFTFLQKDSVYLAKDVIMRNGVIYTKGQNKGTILLQYLQDKSYKKVFYFDDSLFKVEDVQQAFSGSDHDITLYHMKVASKVPYTPVQVERMQARLCNLIETINRTGETACSCEAGAER